MKKNILAISLVVIILGFAKGEISAAFDAEEEEEIQETKNDGFMKRFRDKKNNKSQTAVPTYFKKAKWMLSGDFLWWQSNGGAFTLMTSADASLSDGSGGSAIDIGLSASTKDLKYRWDPGFRLGVARFFDGLDSWDCFFNTTYFRGTAFGKTNIDATLTISPDTIKLSLPSKMNWRLNYYTFDLELGRNFFFNRKVQLRPHFGFRGAIINQNFHSNTGPLTTTINTAGSPLSLTAKSKSSNNFSGFGVRGGGRLIWEISPHVGLLGQLSGSAILGEFDLKSNTETDLELSLASIIGLSAKASIKADDAYFKLRSNLEGLAGLYFKIPTNKKRHLLEIILGYETAIWFKQNELNDFVNALSSTVSSAASFVGSAVPTTASLNNVQRSHLALRGITFNMRYSF